MNKSNIPPEILQQVLASASNAADKGLSQWFTPLDFAGCLARALPAYRPVLADLTCGAGHLLRGCANATTRHLLGSDIDPTAARHAPPASVPGAIPLGITRIHRDITRLAAYLQDCRWQADCLVLNPPFRLFWHRERLDPILGDSATWTVRRSYQDREPTGAGGCPTDGIDSTVALLLLALDRLTLRGEGLLIGNHATLERLVFAADAPHGAIAQHCWGRLILPGNPMTGRTDANFTHDLGPDGAAAYHTEVVYFARDHTAGPRSVVRWDTPWESGTPGAPPPERRLPDRTLRYGMIVRESQEREDTVSLWDAVREQVRTEDGAATEHPWNLWLDPHTDLVRTYLNRFAQASEKTDKEKAARLAALHGKHPMQLVMQRAERDALLTAATKDGWRVDPALLAAVEQAIADYGAARAPLYPLPEIQRLGYLDEHDTIECRRALGPFAVGTRYPLRTQTVKVTRTVSKPNHTTGEPEDLEYTGQELAIYLSQPGEDQPEYAFMDATLRGKGIKVDDRRRGRVTAPTRRDWRLPRGTAAPAAKGPPIDYTLQELCDCFVIPDVPDVATANPDAYAHYCAMLRHLETLTEEITTAV